MRTEFSRVAPFARDWPGAGAPPQQHAQAALAQLLLLPSSGVLKDTLSKEQQVSCTPHVVDKRVAKVNERRLIMNPHRPKRAVLWMVGMFLLVGGFLAAAILVPHTVEPYGANTPAVELPRMVNVPSPHTPKMEIDLPAEGNYSGLPLP
jgi:hypothetical protein